MMIPSSSIDRGEPYEPASSGSTTPSSMIAGCPSYVLFEQMPSRADAASNSLPMPLD